MAIHTINVNFDAQANQLEPDPQMTTVTIGTGDAVEWVFTGTPANCLAFVLFESQNDGWFGPFQSLSPSPEGVTATGNNGSPGTYAYTLMILDDQGALATFGTSLSVVNASTQVDTSPRATVFFDPNIEPSNQRVVVTPSTLSVEQGQTAIWHIYPENILPGHFVTVHFEGFPERPMIGPFQSFSMSPGVGGLVARGEGLSTGSTNQIAYRVRVRAADGTIVGSGDPVIEPLESPPGT